MAGSAALAPSGIAVDGKDDLWVESAKAGLAEFSPAYKSSPGEETNHFIELLGSLAGPDELERLAIEDTSEDFYVTGLTHDNGPGPLVVYERSGTKLHESERAFGHGTVAVDNSPAGSLEDESACGPLPGECVVYVSEFGEGGGVKKLNRDGEEQPFKCTHTECEYIDGEHGGEITGIPGHATKVFSDEGLTGVAVDAKGDIYADDGATKAVYEYAASGRFVQAFSVESPEIRRVGGLIGEPEGVAVDPVSKNVLVTVDADTGGVAVGAVDEFNSVTGRFVAQVRTGAGGGQLVEPVGVSVDSRGDVYVVDEGLGVVDVYGPGVFLPSLVLGAAGERERTSAVLSGSVNPAQEGNIEKTPFLEHCYFQYVTEQEFDVNVAAHGGREGEGFSSVASGGSSECAPDASEIPADETKQPVEAKIGSLRPGVTYRYRLVASTGGVLGGTAETVALAFTAPAPPEVVSVSVGGVSSTFAELRARIRPLGAETSYRFEYDTRPYVLGEAGHGTSVPVPDGQVGAGGPTGGAVESVVQHVGPIVPGTTYYFRVVGVSVAGVAEETEQSMGTFVTQSEAVPSGRAYELVTPASKEGGSDMFASPVSGGSGEFESKDLGTPSESGEGFLLETGSQFGVFPGSFGSAYVFTRDYEKGEWSYRSLAEPALGVQTIGLLGSTPSVFDPVDLSRVAVNDEVGSGQSEAGARELSLLGEPGGPYTLLHADPSFHGRAGPADLTEYTQVVGASHDLSHVVLQSEAILGEHDEACPGAEGVAHGRVLCEWTGGALELVNAKPGSESEPVSACGAGLGAGEGVAAGYAHDAVSGDGSKIFFTAPDPNPERNGGAGKDLGNEGCWNGAANEAKEGPENAPQLYVRVETTEPTGEVTHQTIKVSAATEEGVSVPKSREYPAEFTGASEDGSRVFFVTDTELTSDDAGIHDPELYEWRSDHTSTAGEVCVNAEGCVTRVSHGETGDAAAAVLAVTAVSADGSAVYFLANGVLAANAGANASHATPGGCDEVVQGACDLYGYDTETGTTTYIATVNYRAFTETNGLRVPHSGADWYTTPDGRYLLFKSNLALTGFSNAGSSCYIAETGGGNHGPCAELYRYDSQAAERGEEPLVCVSCGEDGSPPTGNARFSRSAPDLYTDAAAGPVRAMSNDGSYVFFDDPTPLVPGATNGTLDVYQWHEEPESHQQTLSLIGSGTEPGPSYFLGYAPNPAANTQQAREAGNVFIGTHAKLVPADTNSVGNIYDARVCEPDSPCIEPPPGETAQCLGDTCQTPPASPTDPTATLLPEAPFAAQPPPAPVKETAAQIRAEKLAKALKVCRTKKNKHKRAVCEAQARRKYGPVKAKKSSVSATNDRRASR